MFLVIGENMRLCLYMRAQGPNARFMDCHDLSTKFYSPWVYINPRYRDYLLSRVEVDNMTSAYFAISEIRTRDPDHKSRYQKIDVLDSSATILLYLSIWIDCKLVCMDSL